MEGCALHDVNAVSRRIPAAGAPIAEIVAFLKQLGAKPGVFGFWGGGNRDLCATWVPEHVMSGWGQSQLVVCVRGGGRVCLVFCGHVRVHPSRRYPPPSPSFVRYRCRSLSDGPDGLFTLRVESTCQMKFHTRPFCSSPPYQVLVLAPSPPNPPSGSALLPPPT
jgi:hypothetical protein